MSIDSTSSSAVYRKKSLKTSLSQSDSSPFSRYTLKFRHHKPLIHTRAMSVSEDSSGDILTDLSTLPFKQDYNKYSRRFSELKPGGLIQSIPPTNSDRDRRNSIPQISFNSLLPNHFRSHKHCYKSTIKDETNTSVDTPDNSFSSSFNDKMTMKAEPVSSSKILNSTTNGSRTNLSITSEVSSIISHEESVSSLFTLDTMQLEPRSADIFMLELNTPLCVAEIYREHFLEYFHINYYGELQHEGQFIASLRYISNKLDHPTCEARAIIRISNRNYDVSMTVDETNEDNILQVLFKKANLSGIQTCKPIGDPKANEKIYLFDKSNDERQNCKIGFIYQRSNQTDELDIFNNDCISDDMTNFLQILADRVRLKGFEKYRGDLDIKNDLHGEYSYYTQYNNREIMFNVAPMIPSTNVNESCVKRKGLVGNSFVCIVFQESDVDFIPDFITGKVTQIYLTVQPIKINEQTYYKVSVWRRNDLTSVIDPPGGIFESDGSFRDYFLTLLLNSINVAIESPSLRYCISEQRQRLKQEEMKKLVQNLSIGQSFDTVSDVENNNSHVETRPIARTDSVKNSTNDNVLPDTGRESPAPVKKRTLSKIFSVFTSRSGSLSLPSHASNTDLPPMTPPASEGNTVPHRVITSVHREPVKRATSVKHHAAPSPPRAPVSYRYGTTPNLPQTSSHTNVSKLSGLTNDNATIQNDFLNTVLLDEAVRNRSNSSPEDNANTTSRRPLSSVSTTSKEISDTGSSIGDFSGDEYSEDERYEHRPTLTELPLISPPNTNL